MLHLPHPLFQFRAPPLTQMCMDIIFNLTTALLPSEHKYRLLIPPLKYCSYCSIPCLLWVSLSSASLSSPFSQMVVVVFYIICLPSVFPSSQSNPITILQHKIYGAVTLLSNILCFCPVSMIESSLFLLPYYIINNYWTPTIRQTLFRS